MQMVNPSVDLMSKNFMRGLSAMQDPQPGFLVLPVLPCGL